MKNEKSNTTPTGIGFVGLLTIVFITLKLCKVITWSWLLVLSLILISAGLMLLIVLSRIILSIRN